MPQGLYQLPLITYVSDQVFLLYTSHILAFLMNFDYFSKNNTLWYKELKNYLIFFLTIGSFILVMGLRFFQFNRSYSLLLFHILD